MKTTNLLGASLLMAACLPCATHAAATVSAAPEAPGYALKQRWALGDAGKYDYLAIDATHHRLFLTRGDRVQVLDLPSGKVTGEIGATAGVHGVAFAPELKLGFTSNGRANSVTVFDLDTLQVKREVKVSGANPDTILYEPASRKLYTFNGKSADVTVFDAASMKVLATIPVGGRPEFAVADGAGKIYFNIEDKGRIGVLDIASDKLLASWSLAGCEEPSGIAIDAAHARLFSVCQNRVMLVTDAKTGVHVADVAIGEHPDAALYDAATATVFSSNGAGGGSLSVIHQIDADHYAPALSVATEKGARTMAIDPLGKEIYLPTNVKQAFTVLVLAPLR